MRRVSVAVPLSALTVSDTVINASSFAQFLRSELLCTSMRMSSAFKFT